MVPPSGVRRLDLCAINIRATIVLRAQQCETMAVCRAAAHQRHLRPGPASAAGCRSACRPRRGRPRPRRPSAARGAGPGGARLRAVAVQTSRTPSAAGCCVVVAAGSAGIDDLTLAEPAQGLVGQRGDLVLGVAVDTPRPRPTSSRGRGRRGRWGGAAAGLAKRRVVRDSARRAGVALVELAEHASWAHVVWLLRGVLDRAATDPAARPGGAAHDDLFGLADAAAALVDAPVTIEDAHSRVLAYSSRQDVTDPARVSTIVGRRVLSRCSPACAPEGSSAGWPALVSRSSCPPTPAARHCRASSRCAPAASGSLDLGGRDGRPPEGVVRELVQTASVVAPPAAAAGPGRPGPGLRGPPAGALPAASPAPRSGCPQGSGAWSAPRRGAARPVGVSVPSAGMAPATARRARRPGVCRGA